MDVHCVLSFDTMNPIDRHRFRKSPLIVGHVHIKSNKRYDRMDRNSMTICPMNDNLKRFLERGFPMYNMVVN